MLKRLLILSCLLLPAAAAAQTVRADRFTLNTGPCVARSGSGSPEGVVTGSPCDTWERTDTGQTYKKVTGSASNTGWVVVVGGTGATCTTFAGCVAAKITLDTTVFTQQLRTDHSYQLQQYVASDGAHLNAFNGGGWMGLKLAGAPVQVEGGGLYVGAGTPSDPGVGNVNVAGFVGLPGYTSQTTGWRITSAGAADVRYLYTDELHAKSFITDLEQALAGGQIISKSVAKVGATFTVPAPGSISTLTVQDLPSAADMAVFESGDFVRLRSFSRAAGALTITDAWGTVTGYADAADGVQTWTFTRAVANGGAMATGTEIAADAVVLDYGVSGNGFYEVNAIDGAYGVNSPYAQIVTWTGNSPYSGNQTVRARFGNLLGITGTPEYGLIAGTYSATGGRYFLASDQAFELHGIDLKLWNGTTNVLRVDHLTPYWSMGAPAPTSYTSGTGCWSGIDSGVFKWRCGDIAGGTNYIAWNGTQLTVSGSIVIVGTAIDAASVNGVDGSTIVSGAQTALLGLDTDGNPLLPHTASPSGSGLFLGSDYLGYYTGGAWKTYMDSSGGFYLGGVSGALQWNGTTLTITGTLAGNGSAITSITGGNITTGTVTATQIAANTITAAKIAAGTITATELAADSVTSAKIAAGTIVASDIASGTITATQVAASTFVSTGGAAGDVNGNATTISGGKITAGSITASQMTAGTLTAATIAAGTITGSNIAAGTISGSNIAATTVTAANIAAGTITATQIAADAITGAKIAAGTITASDIAVGAITANEIAAGTITGTQIAADAITSAKIAAGTIQASDIAAGTITANEIAASTITAAKMNVSSLSSLSADLGTITAGSVTLGGSGYVRQGQTAYNTGTGFWLGDVSGTPKFSIGNPSGNYMTWDGTTLTVNAQFVTPSTTLTSTGSFSTNVTGLIYWQGGGNGTLTNYDGDTTVGKSVKIINQTASYTLTVKHHFGGIQPQWFTSPTGADLVLQPGDSLTAEYSGSTNGMYISSVTHFTP